MAEPGTGIGLLPSNWNINTLWIIGMGVIVFAGNWYVNGYRLDQISNDLKNFQAIYATLDRVASIQTTASRDASDLKSAVSALGMRIDAMQGMIGSLDRSSSQQGADITNIKDRLADLGRQGRVRGLVPEPKFTEIPTTVK